MSERIDHAGGVGSANGVATERTESVGDVGGARGVVLKRACSKTCVNLRRSDPRQRGRENKRSYKNGEKRSRVGRMAKRIKPSCI